MRRWWQLQLLTLCATHVQAFFGLSKAGQVRPRNTWRGWAVCTVHARAGWRPWGASGCGLSPSDGGGCAGMRCNDVHAAEDMLARHAVRVPRGVHGACLQGEPGDVYLHKGGGRLLRATPYVPRDEAQSLALTQGYHSCQDSS
jgi:hypothetical protein